MARSDDSLEPSPFATTFRDEYAPVALRGGSLGLLSLLFFFASLFARFVVSAVAPDGVGYFRRAFLSAMLVPILAGIGLLFGLIGARLSGGGGLARTATWLNLVVVVLGCLALAAFYWILPDNWTPIQTRP